MFGSNQDTRIYQWRDTAYKLPKVSFGYINNGNLAITKETTLIP